MDLKHDYWSPRKILEWITHIVSLVHVGLATSIIVGGFNRFNNPSMQPLIKYVDGEVWIWGIIIFVSGLLISTPFRWVSIFGLWIGMCWHFMWMASFVVAVHDKDNATATAVPMYGGMAIICAIFLLGKMLDKEA